MPPFALTLPPRAVRGFGLLLVAGGLAGCVSTESCDPNKVDFVLQSAACGMSGAYDARIANLDANESRINEAVIAERQALAAANRRVRDAVLARKITSAEAQAIQSRIGALNSDIARLKSAKSPAAESAIQTDIRRKQVAINEFATFPVF